MPPVSGRGVKNRGPQSRWGGPKRFYFWRWAFDSGLGERAGRGGSGQAGDGPQRVDVVFSRL